MIWQKVYFLRRTCVQSIFMELNGPGAKPLFSCIFWFHMQSKYDWMAASVLCPSIRHFRPFALFEAQKLAIHAQKMPPKKKRTVNTRFSPENLHPRRQFSLEKTRFKSEICNSKILFWHKPVISITPHNTQNTLNWHLQKHSIALNGQDR